MEAKKVTKKVTKFEIVAYIIAGLISLWGITLLVLGVVEQFIDHKLMFYEGALRFASLFGLHFLGWGLILTALGAVLFSFVLCIYARSADREYEKAQRRAARLGKADETAPEVVDAEISK